jgi:hypothetical protein
VLAQVRERGFITTGEIFAAFPDLDPDADELHNLWEMFESRGISVLDDGGVVAAKAYVAPDAPVESRVVNRDPSRRLQMPPEELILGLDSGRRLICIDLHEPLSAIIERDNHFVLVSKVGSATSVDVRGAISWSTRPAAAPSSARPSKTSPFFRVVSDSRQSTLTPVTRSGSERQPRPHPFGATGSCCG